MPLCVLSSTSDGPSSSAHNCPPKWEDWGQRSGLPAPTLRHMGLLDLTDGQEPTPRGEA